MTRRVFPVLATALALLLGSAAPAVPAPPPKLQEIQERLEANRERLQDAREESRDVREDLEVAEGRRETVAGRLEEIRDRLAEAQARLAEVRAELNVARDHLSDLTAELQQARADLEERQAILDERAAAAYRLGPATYLDVVLGAEDIESLSARVGYVEGILSVDADLVEGVRFARSVVNDRQGRIASYEADVAARESEVAERTQEIARLEQEAAALLGQVDLEIQVQTDTLDDLQEAKEKYEEAVAQLEAESARIQSVIQGAGSSGSGSYGGELFWPTPGPIVSGYGYRTHPIYGSTRFHSGVDMDGACGQPLYAAADGTVISAASTGGSGLATVIDHGDGLSAL